MNILVCEDHKAIQDLIEMVLLSNGYNIYKCPDGDCVEKIIEDKKIDLLIIDYWLDDVTADEVIKVLKSKHDGLPIILISAINNLKEVKEELGVEDYLQKPFDLEDLTYKVNNLIHDTKNSNSRG